MKPSDAADLVVVVKSYWPHYATTKAALQDAVAAYFDALSDVEYPDAEAAVRELGREGREFAPPPGVVRQTVERTVGAGCPLCGRRGSHAHDRMPGLRLPTLPSWSEPDVPALPMTTG